MLKDFLSLKTFIPNFVAFFVSTGIVISCVYKMSFSVTSAKCPLVRDSEPIRLLEIPMSLSLHTLIEFIL